MIKPKMIDIEITTRCNLRCIGCPVNDNNNIGDMDFDLYKSIIDRAKAEIPDTTIVQFLDGEPTLHPRYTEMIKYTNDKGLRQYFTTNGHLWMDDLFNLITDKDSTTYQVIFSLDGMPDEKSRSIEKARPGSIRTKVLDTIHRFGELKLKKQSKIDMAVKIVKRGQDNEEIEHYISHWLRQPFIDYVCVGNMLDTKTDGMRIYPCRYSDNQFMVIKWDGSLVPCAYCWGLNNNSRSWGFGKLDKTTPLLEVYNNPLYTEFRNDQRSGKFRDECKTCGFAYTGYGFDGSVEFKNKDLDVGKIYYHNDYYNTFYSLKHKRHTNG